MKLFTISLKLILLSFVLFSLPLFAGDEVRQYSDTIHNVTIQISPFDAECRINGSVVVPNEIEKLKAGDYTVVLTKNGYKSYSNKFTVSRDNRHFLFIMEPEKITGLLVKTDPPGASVYIDGELKGTSDAGFLLPVKKYRVKVELEKYLPVEQEIDGTQPAKLYTLNLKLQKNTGYLKINSNMKDLIVEIDGEVTKQEAQYELESGNHSIRVTASNCSEYTTQVNITRGKTSSIKANLEKLTGEVILYVTPSDALVVIGVANYENARKFELEPGNYKMHLSSDLYDTKTIDLVVQKGKTNRVNVQLVKNAGMLSMTRRPESAKIVIDGKDYGATDKIELRSGSYHLEAVVDSSYHPFAENISITKNKTTTLKVDVKRRKGVFLFNSIPFNTKVRLLQKGETKFEFNGTGIIEELPVGRYVVLVQSPGHRSVRSEMMIEENKNYILDLKLEQGVDEILRTETTAAPAFLKKIDGGYFEMGATPEQGNGTRMELPVRTVAVNMFYIGTTEVTQGLWNEVMGENPSHFKSDHVDNSLPVENISWLEAVKFCNKLSEKEGLTPCYKIDDAVVSCNFEANGYRLPTEAEWEYAARGDDSTAQFIFSGSKKVEEVAWIKSNSDKRTHPVAQKSPNKNGLYDMTGNVAELCNDFYDKYNPADLLNPKGPETGKKISIRGGSWNSTEGKARISARESNGTGARKSTTGLRLVRSGS
ncbi:hypothetical protein MASR2M39_11850 [Ignavibacteriales bacterium]